MNMFGIIYLSAFLLTTPPVPAEKEQIQEQEQEQKTCEEIIEEAWQEYKKERNIDY